MRFRLLTMLGIATIGAWASAEPPALPAPRKLGEPASEDPASAERAKLQSQLSDLLKRLDQQPPLGPVTNLNKLPPSKKIESFDGSVDPLRVATNLFRDNDFEAAQRAFKFVNPASLGREDRVFAQYMTACSLRRLKKHGEAAAIYREIADAREDEFIADMALWQLSLHRSSQELEAQIEQLRSHAKTR